MGGREREREKKQRELNLTVYVCAQMKMGGINDQCVTGKHLFGSCGFSNGTEILKEMIYIYLRTHIHTKMYKLRCISLARGNSLRVL